MSPVRILFISPQIAGGSIESLLQLVSHLDEAKYHSSVLFLRPTNDALIERFEDVGVSVLEFRPKQDGPAERQRRKNPSAARRALRTLAGKHVVQLYSELLSIWHTLRHTIPTAKRAGRIVHELHPDLVYVNSAPHSGLAGILAARFSARQCICHVRNLSNPSWIQRRCSASVARYIFNSNEVRRHLIAQGIGASNGAVIFNGVDIAGFKPSGNENLRTDLGFEEDAKLVGIIGRLDHWKGHSVFVEALRLLKDRGLNVKGVVVGERQGGVRNEAYADEVHRAVEAAGLQDSIRFTGFRSDIADIMSQLDIVVLASTDPEPFGRVIIESMAIGTPVIATAAGGVLDIIQEGHNGLLVEPGDPESLAEAVGVVYADPQRAAEMAMRAKRDAAERFSSERHAAAIAALIDDVLAERE